MYGGVLGGEEREIQHVTAAYSDDAEGRSPSRCYATV
jgi:hypothetical protein